MFRKLFLFGLLGLSPALFAAKTLDVYFIDVEGGQSTLIVSPSGESMLIDAGWPGYSMRDANRIAAAAKLAKIKQIDYMVVTHYHVDHVGGVPQLVQKMPVMHFIDHGPNREDSKSTNEGYAAYEQVATPDKRKSVGPGATIPLKGVDVKVVTADGENYKSTLSEQGPENPQCTEAIPGQDDPSENARSLGVLLKFGRFKMVDLGDLTWQKEMALACPVQPIGTVDLYVVDHHGFNISNAPTLVQTLGARVAVVDCGAHKGGTKEAYQVIRRSPHTQDIWQLHYAFAAGKENNPPDSFLANLEEQCVGNYIKVSASEDGSFTVFNSRNNFTKTYPALPIPE